MTLTAFGSVAIGRDSPTSGPIMAAHQFIAEARPTVAASTARTFVGVAIGIVDADSIVANSRGYAVAMRRRSGHAIATPPVAKSGSSCGIVRLHSAILRSSIMQPPVPGELQNGFENPLILES
jgi:hypothetical protein